MHRFNKNQVTNNTNQYVMKNWPWLGKMLINVVLLEFRIKFLWTFYYGIHERTAFVVLPIPFPIK